MEVSEQDVLDRLRTAVAAAGSLRAFGEQHQLSAAYVHDVLNKRRILGERICAAVGVERIVQVTYHDKRTEKSTSMRSPNDHPTE